MDAAAQSVLAIAAVIAAIATAGVIAGTLFGGRLLRRIPEAAFRRVVAVLLAILGVALLVRAS